MRDESREGFVTSPRVIERLRECLPYVLDKRPVLAAYVYGSVAAGCTTPMSDVDIALVLNPGVALDGYQRFMLELEIEAEIEDVCGVIDADVRIINDAPLSVQGEVVTEGHLVFSKDEDLRVAYEVQTRTRYFDFMPVLKMMQRAYFERMEEDLRREKLL